MREDYKPSHSRRAVLLGAASAAAIGSLFAGGAMGAQEYSLPHVDENDPQARAVAYAQDAANVDRKTNPMFKAGSCCSNCVLSRGKAGEPWRRCYMFSGRLVNASGWCRGWTRNPQA